MGATECRDQWGVSRWIIGWAAAGTENPQLDANCGCA